MNGTTADPRSFCSLSGTGVTRSSIGSGSHANTVR